MIQIMNSQNVYAVLTMSLACPSIVLGAQPFTVPSTNIVEQDVRVFHTASAKMAEEVDIDDLLISLEQEKEFGTDMAKARKWLADGLSSDLSSLRLRRGLSQAQLAKLVGLRQPNISAIESGNRKPEYETARKIAFALGVTTEEIYEAFEVGKVTL